MYKRNSSAGTSRHRTGDVGALSCRLFFSGWVGLSGFALGCALGAPLDAVAQSFFLTEFSAANYSGLRDVDGEYSDWVEIYNAGEDAASLGGWYLCNDPLNLTQWQVPDVVVPGRGSLVVFASGKDRSDPGGELHTDFKLSRDGEFLALMRPDGATAASLFSPQYPMQVSDVSYGVRMETATTIYVAPDADARWWLPGDGQLGMDWTLPGFDDTAWTPGALAIGYDRADSSTNSPVYPDLPVPDITQPQDPIVASSPNSPAGEGVANAIDGDPNTKYLNSDELDAGFTVTPAAGRSVVTGLRFTSANDAPARDPTSFVLSGSNDGQTFSVVAQGPIPDFMERFFTVEVSIDGAEPYLQYRLRFPTLRDASAASAMQIAEVEFVGLIAGAGGIPPSIADVTVPGDFVYPTSASSPGNEGVLNAIDNDLATKYLNFDKLGAGLTVTPAVGETVVTGLRLTSANDAPDRDPASFVLSGSNDGQNFALIAQGDIPVFPSRFATVEIALTNDLSYLHYRLLFPTVWDPANSVAMQIAEIEFVGSVGPALPTFKELIGTDLDAEMFGQRTSAYLRIPFTVGPSNLVDVLALQVRYDDGFVAYLNGTEVARANAPAAPVFDSAATADRPRPDALTWERFSLQGHVDLIQPGENVLAVHALNDQADSPEFLLQVQLENVRVTLGENGYFETPTPGGINASLSLGLVEEPVLDRPHGLYDSPFSVTLSNVTEGASIRYTTNGSAPTVTTGQPYLDPILIDRTTVLRAAAFREDWRPSPVATATYLFPDDIITQDAPATLAAGFPARWNGQASDYGFDARVIGPAGQDNYGGKYAAEIREALRSLPSMSIVMDADDMFGTQGIYSNPESRGDSWERAASLELIYPDQPGGFQQDAGIRIQGGAFRRFDLTLKKSFRLVFREQYGATKLTYPLFGPDATDAFDNFILRANSNDAWRWGSSAALYIRDAFADETLRAMGGVAPHSNFVHLYVNGFYWGLYNPVERPDASFSATYIGGDKDTWDALNQDSAPDGDYQAWNRLLALLGQDASSNEVYQQLQGNFPDGTRNPAYEDLLDVDNMIDYIILNLYVGNVDWPQRNFWVGRDRNNGDGFKFYPWDSETALGLGSDLNTNRTGVDGLVARPYAALRANAEFRMRFADRVHRHFFNGGALYVNPLAPAWDPAQAENNRPAERLSALADLIDSAMVAESGRWGDQLNDAPFTRDEHWRKERDRLLADYFPQRSVRVLQQFRDAGLYPQVDAPVFNQPGGPVAAGFALTMTAPAGAIYYTTNGTDPRSPLDPADVFLYSEPIVLQDLTTVRARVLDGAEWSALNDATFVIGTPRLVLSELNYHPYNRTVEEVLAGFADDDEFEFIELLNSGTFTFDLIGVHFTDGVEFDFTGSAVTRLPVGQHVLVVRNRAAFEMRYGTDRPVAGEYIGGLSNGGERIALADGAGTPIFELTYGTATPWPSTADGSGPTLEIRDLTGPIDAADNWQISATAGGSPGRWPPVAPAEILEISRAGNTLLVVFYAQAGHPYVVYGQNPLNAGTWEPCGSIAPSITGGPTEVRLDTTGQTAQQFFRIAAGPADPSN